MVAWGLMASLAIGSYFMGYHEPATSPPPAAALADPFSLAGFLLASLGSPFAFGMPIDNRIAGIAAGAVVLALFAAVYIYILFYNKDLRRRAMPFLLYGAFAMATMLGIAIGRSGYGLTLNGAFATRYINQEVMVLVALVFLLPLALRQVARPVTHGLVCGALAVVMAALHISDALRVMEGYPEIHRMECAGKTAMLFSNCFEEQQLLGPFWRKPAKDMLPPLEFLAEHGYFKPTLIRDARIDGIKGNPQSNMPVQLGAMDQRDDQPGNESSWEAGRYSMGVLRTPSSSPWRPVTEKIAQCLQSRRSG